MKKQTKIDPKDWEFVPAEPDPDFNEEHSRAVIAKTLKDSEKYRRAQKREYKENLSERTEAMAKYLKSVETGKGESDVTKYFGRRKLAELRGEFILNKLKKAYGVN